MKATGKTFRVWGVSTALDRETLYSEGVIFTPYEESLLEPVRKGDAIPPTGLDTVSLDRYQDKIKAKTYAYEKRSTGKIEQYTREFSGNQYLIRAPLFDQVIQ